MASRPWLSVALTTLVTSAAAQSRPEEAATIPLGGPATVHDDGPDAFSFPAGVLDRAERRAFAIGNSFFKTNWVTAPASTEGRDGLGPLFNARSCSSCHFRDGRGRPADPGEDTVTGLLLRVGTPGPDGDVPHPVYGGQLQDRAIHGVAPEVTFAIRHERVTGAFGDGTTFELLRPGYEIADLAYGPLGEEARLGARVAQQLIGLGLLEAIPEDALLARSDPDDEDGDGISGRPHLVATPDGEPRLGRFGWKATQPTVRHQSAAAFVHDIGITSSLFPTEVVTGRQAPDVSFASGGSPEIDDHKLDRLTFYTLTLAVPAQRNPDDPRVIRGAEHFEAMGCAACHVPVQHTGSRAFPAAYANRPFRPYTDLLLHDLGDGLADQKHDGQASPREWRTPPLWGIGLFETVNGHTRYLHDGRARDLTEAVLWHGGEARAAREAFRKAPAEDRQALLRFLRSL